MVTLKGYTANMNGLSTDSKPTTNVDINTIFRELDTNKYYYFGGTTWTEIPNTGGGGGGGFVPTETQLAAINSGVTSTDVEQIGTNKNDILTIGTKVQGIDSTGDDFIEINGKKLYFSTTTPSNPSDGDWWLN